MSDLNLKDVFVTDELRGPIAELEELNAKLRKKKAEVKKAIFFSKHPELLMAKKEVEAGKAEKSVHAFNEVVAKDVQQAVAEAPKKEVKEPQPEPVKPMELSRPAPQHVKTPLKVGLGKWWL